MSGFPSNQPIPSKEVLDSIKADPMLRTFLERSLIGCALAGPDHRLVMVNEAFCNMLGYDQDELLTKTYMDITHPDDLKISNEVNQKLHKKGTSCLISKRYMHKDGRAIYAKLSIIPYLMSNKPTGYLIAQIIDISEQVAAHELLEESRARLNERVKERTLELENTNRLLSDEIKARAKAQAALEVSEKQYRQVVENQTEMLCQFLPDTTLTFVNRAYANCFGSTPDALIGKKFINFVPESERSGIWKNLASISQTGDAKHYQHEVVLPDGQTVCHSWVDLVIHSENGKPTLFQSVGHDITHIKKLEKEVSLNESRLRFALESSGIDYFIWEPDSDSLETSNWWINHLGYTEESYRHNFKVWREKIHPEDREYVRESFQDLLKKRKDILNISYRLKNAKDEWLWINSQAKVMLWRDSHALSVIGISMDITERRTFEEKLRQAKDAAEVATQAKTHFLANMSHEIRTPLNGILGTTDWLLNQAPLPSTIHDGLNVIRDSSDGLLSLINDILDFSRLESDGLKLVPFPFQPMKLMQDLHALFEVATRERNHTFVLQPDPELPDWLFGDANRIRQVLLNILGNAIKFTPDGGTITFSSEKMHHGKDWVHVGFKISDTGIGIPQDKQSEIFRRFTQADPSMTRNVGGAGLGLAISSHLVELMGGRLKVESEPRKGSTFSFDIRIDLIEQTKETDPSGHHEKNTSNLNILVAEDNPINQKVVTRLLEDASHNVTIAVDGMEALDFLEERSFDLVFLDIQMPGMDGFETVQQIRKSEANTGRHQKVIALTAMAMHEDRERCISLGMDDYLAKPIRRKDLLQKIAQHCL